MKTTADYTTPSGSVSTMSRYLLIIPLLLMLLGLAACGAGGVNAPASSSSGTNNGGTGSGGTGGGGTGATVTLQSIAITPATNTISIGATASLTATGTYSDNSRQDITTHVTWTSATPATASVAASTGVVTGVAVGTTSVTAALNGITSPAASLTITGATLTGITLAPVNPSIAIGATTPFTATGTYSDSSTGNISGSVVWSSSNTTVATINSSGIATGVSPGTSNITASLSGIASTPLVTITVRSSGTGTAPTLSSIAVTPATNTIAIGATVGLMATGTFSDSSTQDITAQVTWSSATPAIASVGASSGVVTGVAAGSANVTAALSGITSSANITVTASLSSIAITPGTASIVQGATTPFTATGTYSDNSTNNITGSVTWNTSNTTIATINSSGIASGVAVGNSNITATLSGFTSNTAALTVTPPPPNLALFAGDLNVAGSVDSNGSSARFSKPYGIASDSAGNIYVADGNNYTIRKISATGVVSTFAGTAGVIGSADGTGAAASFKAPFGVATDSAGNVYVSDRGNNTIRKITPAGVVSTFAGTAGAGSSADGSGAVARFNYPSGLATDSAGNVYVADTFNQTIRKITPAGVVSTLAGTPGTLGSADASGAAASFYNPHGIATDSAGNLFVADTFNHTIRKITSAGVVSTLAGTAGALGSADGSGVAARFNWPHGIAADNAGNVYVADTYNHAIRKITAAGVVSTFAGGVLGSADGSGAAAKFYRPEGIAMDSAGNMYVADTFNHTIRKITATGVVSTLAGMAGVPGSADGSIAVAYFNGPNGLTTDSAGNIYVADTGNFTIRKITASGAVSTFAGTAGMTGSVSGSGAAARFNSPRGVTTDSTGNVYVSDRNAIRNITPTGVVSTFAGMNCLVGCFGSADGTGAAASFDTPIGVATDSAGNVYVADNFNSTIRKITPSGVVSTFAGTAGVIGSADGTGAAASFNGPFGIATDSAGNLYVADRGVNTIRKITPVGVVSTFAGTAGVMGSADGTGAAARFKFPTGIATDSADNVYVADTGNHTIRKITPAGVVTTVVGIAGQAVFTPGALPGGLTSPNYLAIHGTMLYITLLNGVAVVNNLP